MLEEVMDNIKKIKEKIKLHNWAQEIEACNSSGLNIKEWCRAHNMSTVTYYRHLKSVRQGAIDGNLQCPVTTEETYPQFTEITPQISAAATEFCDDTSQIDSYTIKLNIKGMGIEIFNGADKNTLLALLSAVNEI